MATMEEDRHIVPAIFARDGAETPVFVESFEEGDDLMTIRLVIENDAGDVEGELVLSRHDLTGLWFRPRQR
jgi:hypothetical protein